MIFWIALGMFIFFLALSVIMKRLDGVLTVIYMIIGMIVFAMVIHLMIDYLGSNGYHEKLVQKQIALEERVEHMNILNTYDILKDVADWNEDLAQKKANQHDKWIGIFVPDIYDDLEFVEIDKG